mgnify:CR=1 FL=1
MTDKHRKSTLRTTSRFRRSGIHYVCVHCGTLLYHIGPEGSSERARALRTREDLYLLRPSDVAVRLKRCPKCGHRLQSRLDPGSFKVRPSGFDMASLLGTHRVHKAIVAR